MTPSRRRRQTLTDADVQRVRRLHRQGMRLAEIAARYGVSEKHLELVIRGVRRTAPREDDLAWFDIA